MGRQLSLPEMREMRTRIRGAINLTSGGETITEEPDGWWSANVQERKLHWTPYSPYGDHPVLNDDLLLYLVAHEASHLKWTGGYDVDGLKGSSAKLRFHRFLNAVEDIRVDRLSEQHYGEFGRVKQNCRRTFRDQFDKDGAQNWCPVDQVALNAIYSHDINAPALGTQDGIDLAAKWWPTIDRIANCASTQEVADALLPIFHELDSPNMRADEEDEPRDGKHGDGDESEDGQSGQGGSSQSGDDEGEQDSGGSVGQQGGEESEDGDLGEAGDDSGSGAGSGQAEESVGADEPTSRPTKSSGSMSGASAPGSELQGMADDARDQRTKNALDTQIVDNDYNAASGRAVSATLEGPRSSPHFQGQSAYDARKARVRPSTIALANRLKGILRHNAQDSWESGKRRGRLHTGKAWRAQAGNPRIFRKRGAVGGQEYTVGLLVDTSSSMASEMEQTADAAVMLAEALERAGIGVFVVTWNDYPTSMKRLHQSLSSAAGDLGYGLHASGGTTECNALVLALNEFEKAGRDSAKLLITLTDGDTTQQEQSVEMLAELERKGVPAVAVRIREGDFARQYKDRLTVKHATELPRVLPQIINRIIHKGR